MNTISDVHVHTSIFQITNLMSNNVEQILQAIYNVKATNFPIIECHLLFSFFLTTEVLFVFLFRNQDNGDKN